ncbi:MAG TPA: hypothetical protein PK598_06130, partial [Thermoanaerobaculia bacterium]|nr:hypothetical protein [Thermoanaerobaculia bacterium]
MLIRRRSQGAGVPILLLLIGLAAGCASGPGPVASAGGGDAPAVLTGVTLLADGATPRLLLSGSGRLQPTVFARDGQTRFVIDLPDAVVSPGMEPPRADGTVLAKVEMRSFSELGRPHVQFELVSRSPVALRIGSEAGSSSTAVLFDRIAPEPVVAAVPEPAPVKVPEPPAVVAEHRAAPPATPA